MAYIMASSAAMREMAKRNVVAAVEQAWNATTVGDRTAETDAGRRYRRNWELAQSFGVPQQEIADRVVSAWLSRKHS